MVAVVLFVAVYKDRVHHVVCSVLLHQTEIMLVLLSGLCISETMIDWIGFKNCLITCGGIMSLNLLLGAMYREPHNEAAIVEKRSNARQISLKIKGKPQSHHVIYMRMLM